MAIIDFKCNQCQEKFSELVNSSNRDKVVCPKCASKEIKQVFEGKCNSAGSSSAIKVPANPGCNGCCGCH